MYSKVPLVKELYLTSMKLGEATGLAPQIDRLSKEAERMLVYVHSEQEYFRRLWGWVWRLAIFTIALFMGFLYMLPDRGEGVRQQIVFDETAI